MTLDAERIDPPVEDAVSNVLKWVLLVVAIATFGLLAWATTVTYRTAPPQHERFVGAVRLPAGPGRGGGHGQRHGSGRGWPGA